MQNLLRWLNKGQQKHLASDASGDGSLFFRSRPQNYGDWWRSDAANLEFYECIYEDRKPQHLSFMQWVRRIEEKDGPIKSVCEVGCGRGIGYVEFFKGIRFVGVDISEKEIAWCRAHHHNPLHEWIHTDFIEQPPDEVFDLVFCQGTIENVYDMDALLMTMAKHSRRYIHVTAFRGYFPELEEHHYQWSEGEKCFTNKLSPAKTRAVLEKEGFARIDIYPEKTSKTDIPYETVIIAYR